MERSVNSIIGNNAVASDGEVGTVFDFFFDDEAWGLRYVVIDTGNWLPSEKRLLALTDQLTLDPESGTLMVQYLKEVIEHSPTIDLAKPVTTEEEIMVRRHYGAWPHWAPYFVGAGPHKMTALRDRAAEDLEQHEDLPRYALHSFREIGEFTVAFDDESERDATDFVFDPSDWMIRGVDVGGGTESQFVVPMDRISSFDRELRTFQCDSPQASFTGTGKTAAER